MKGEKLGNEWAHQGEGGKAPTGGNQELETLQELMEVWTGDKEEREEGPE